MKPVRLVRVPEDLQELRVPRLKRLYWLETANPNQPPRIRAEEDVVPLRSWTLRSADGRDQPLPGRAGRLDDTVYATDAFPAGWADLVREG